MDAVSVSYYYQDESARSPAQVDKSEIILYCIYLQAGYMFLIVSMEIQGRKRKRESHYCTVILQITVVVES
jgi:hypothetical protein